VCILAAGYEGCRSRNGRRAAPTNACMEAALTPSATRSQLTADDLFAPFTNAYTPEALWRVGTEAEKFGVLSESGAPIAYDGARGVHATLQLLQEMFGWYPVREHEGGEIIALERGGESITLEPGGQVELSGAPHASIHDSAREWRNHLDELNQVGARLGITWLGLGFHPFAQQSDLPWVPKLRYTVMREYLPTRGKLGLDMMRRTCTVQANLDYSSEADAMRKMRVALRLSPIITAMFANSPLVEAKLTGERTHRARVWLDTDPDRTGLLPFMWDEQASIERYVEWALDVPMFLVKRSGKVVHNTGQTFRAFMRDGFQGTEATPADWSTHLGTLFPEVRLKKTIELRGADCLPRALVPALPALAKGLLYDAAALTAADALAETISPRAALALRSQVADEGLRAVLQDRPLRDWAADVIDIARAGLQRLRVIDPETGRDESCHLEPLADLVERDLTPADALIEKLDPSRNLVAQVLELARL
jgi:glutamate--cysteine ligase